MSTYFPPCVLEAYIKAYANFGARSPEKLKPVHGELATKIEREYKSLGKHREIGEMVKYGHFIEVELIPSPEDSNAISMRQ
jgi:hypothetical protein